MPKNLNSATRLRHILIQAESIHDNTPVVDAWASIFGITESNQSKKSVFVSSNIRLMLDELENVRSQMRSTEFSEELYSPSLSQIENTLSMTILGGHWSQIKQHLRPETLCSLAYCTEILPSEEDQISQDDIEAIRTLLDELRSSLVDAQVPDRLKKLIEAHIKLIETALSEYQIIGERALRQAIRAGIGGIAEVQNIIRENNSAPIIRTLGELWKKVSEAADNAQRIDALTQLGKNAWELIANILPLP